MEVVVRIQRNALPFPLWSCYHEYSWKKNQIEKKILEVYLKQIQKRDNLIAISSMSFLENYYTSHCLTNMIENEKWCNNIMDQLLVHDEPRTIIKIVNNH